MAKYSAEELSSRVNELDLDDEVKISLMEDITDSVSPDESEELAGIKADYEELKEKYKARFLKAVEDEEVKNEVEDEDLEEKEVIDVKEL